MEFRRHPGTRFDGDDPGPALVEEAGGDARAGPSYLRLGRLPLAFLRAAGFPVRAVRRFS